MRPLSAGGACLSTARMQRALPPPLRQANIAWRRRYVPGRPATTDGEQRLQGLHTRRGALRLWAARACLVRVLARITPPGCTPCMPQRRCTLPCPAAVGRRVAARAGPGARAAAGRPHQPANRAAGTARGNGWAAELPPSWRRLALQFETQSTHPSSAGGPPPSPPPPHEAGQPHTQPTPTQPPPTLLQVLLHPWLTAPLEEGGSLPLPSPAQLRTTFSQTERGRKLLALAAMAFSEGDLRPTRTAAASARSPTKGDLCLARWLGSKDVWLLA